MNLGVIGWWNNGNQGDFAILENITGALAAHHVVPIDVPFQITPDEVARLNQLDFLIFGGGGLLTTSPAVPFDTFDIWGSDLRTPIGIVGLGVDEVRLEHRQAVDRLLDRAKFVYVRDTTSQQILNHPKVQLMPDVTFWQPRPTSPHSIDLVRPHCGVNLRSLSQADRQQWITTLRALSLNLRGVPLATYSAFEELETLQAIDPQVSCVFDYGLYQQIDLMIGTAFHAVVFAIQAGVPVIAVSYAPKVARLMTELGLSDFLLKTDDWHRLADLVERIKREHESVATRLREITRQLSQITRQIMLDVQRQIENAASTQQHTAPLVSIIILDSDSTEATQRTLNTCLRQTYPNTEIILVSTSQKKTENPAVKVVACTADASLAQRINTGLAKASGQYLAWINAGDRYTLDAIAVLALGLQQDPACAATCADYYTMREPQLIAAAHCADEPSKLIRRDVVGPCFLYRRPQHGQPVSLAENTTLPAYDFWLRIHQTARLTPIHARLMYCQSSSAVLSDRAAERRTRHQWRVAQPWLKRLIWNIVDTEVVESLAVQPLLRLRHRLKVR